MNDKAIGYNKPYYKLDTWKLNLAKQYETKRMKPYSEHLWERIGNRQKIFKTSLSLLP